MAQLYTRRFVLGLFASIPFAALFRNPVLTASPNPAPVGSIVTVTGTDFGHARTRLLLDGVGATTNVFRPSRTGTFTVGVRVSATPKSQTLVAEQYSGGIWKVVARLAPLLTFTPVSGVDTTAPIVTGVNAINITNTTFTVTWTTNEPATSQVDYGTTTSYLLGPTVFNGAFVTTHQQLVSGLSPSTLYHYRVLSKDAANNLVTGSDQQITTIASGTDTTAPVISNIVASSITTTSVAISWTLDEPATGQVEYGLTTSYGQFSTLEASFVYSAHNQTLSSLTPNRTYHYRVRSQDASGNLAISGDRTFTTLASLATMYAPIYGSGFGMDSRNNYLVGGLGFGGTGTRKVAMRFIASQSSIPTAISVIERGQGGGAGYSGGTGGTVKCAIQADVGGYPSGTDLMVTSWAPGNPAGDWEKQPFHVFSGGVALTAGTRYHLVFTQADSAPQTNFISLNVSYIDTGAVFPAQRQPAFTNDLAMIVDVNSGWKAPGDGLSNPDPNQDTPVFDLVYANGKHDGNGYFSVILGATNSEISGTTKMARERFTVSGSDQLVNRMAFRAMRTASTGDLTIRLEDSAGTSIVSGTAPSSGFPLVGVPPNNFGSAWGIVDFSPAVTLLVGTTYNLRASCAAGTTYWTFALQEQNTFDADPDWGSRLFTDGGGERTTDGTNWTPFYEFAPVDAQFYLTFV